MNSPLLEKLAESWRPDTWKDVTVVVALSGGADSVALLRGLVAIARPGSGRLVAAHFNHRLRRESSDGDAEFVRQLCDQIGIPSVLGQASDDSMNDRGGRGLEAVARAERYRFLKETALEWGARFVATAHTADDQAETILHRILRGTALRGLAGIPRTRPLAPGVTVIRPLLGVTRREIIAALREWGQTYREDASNQDVRFTRNRLRHQLLPHLQRQYNRNVQDALLRLGRLAAETQQLLEQSAVDQLDRSLIGVRDDEARLNRRALAEVPPLIVRETLVALWKRQGWPLRDMTAARWEGLAEMIISGVHAAGTRTLPGNVSVDLDGHAVVFRRTIY